MAGLIRGGWLAAFLVVVDLFAVACAARAAAPTPTDPSNMAMGGLPGAFPTSVTAANIKVEQFTPAVMNGSGSDNLKISFPASGPIKWTESRHNEGDISLLIGPSNPTDASYFPPNAFTNDYKPLDGQPFANTTLGWRVSRTTGAALATVRHNGVNYGSQYTLGGQPVGTIHGTAYFNQTTSAGWGFRMSDGVFANGGGTSTDLQMGNAGYENSLGEASSNTAVAYFPYEQGWKGAWVNSGATGNATFNSSSPGLPTNTVVFTAGVPFVKLAGVDSDTDGMLFVAPTDSSDNTNIAAAFPVDDGWRVAVREDDDAFFSGSASSLVPSNQNSFQFLYVPYNSTNLIGGHVMGSDGSLIHSAGDALFDITRSSAGQYSLSVFASDGQTKLTENDGMLILSVAGAAPGGPTLADRKMMSYEYSAGSGDFVIQSRELTATGQPQPPSETQFGDVLSLADVNFYFAWVSFTNPLGVGLPGDYNANGVVDAADYVVWRKNNGNTMAQLPNDSTPGVDETDYAVWKGNFGRGGASGSALGQSAQAVPEPSAVAISSLLVAAFATVFRRRAAR